MATQKFDIQGNYVSWDPRTGALVFSVKDSSEGIFEGRETFRISDRKIVEHLVRELGFDNPAQMTSSREHPTDIRLVLEISRYS